MGQQKTAGTWIAPVVRTIQFKQLCALDHPICLGTHGRSSSRGGGWMWQETGYWAAASRVRVPQSPSLQCHGTGWWSSDFCSMSSLMVSGTIVAADLSLLGVKPTQVRLFREFGVLNVEIIVPFWKISSCTQELEQECEPVRQFDALVWWTATIMLWTVTKLLVHRHRRMQPAYIPHNLTMK